jgi:3-phenylpropionate/cinnamic acid dioxygenase small subunit
MAERIRREKDIIRRTVDRYIKATTEDYSKYFEGSPTYITYYQLDSIATKQDGNLENVNNLLGANTPNKYKKIDDVVVYGVDNMDISNEINEKGLQSSISGEFILLPDSVKPYPGDFFFFDYDDLRDHLFRIDSVQYDKASPKKFFRVSYTIYQDNAELITGNVEGQYTLNYQNIGGEETAVIKKSDADLADKAKLMVDSLIKKYKELFYDEDMDVFMFQTIDPALQSTTGVWSPYLQKFLFNNKVLNHYKKEILEEVYIQNINETSNKEFFSDYAYNQSIFRKLETQDSRLSFENTFMAMSIYNLKETHNLPFFYNPRHFRLLRIYDNKADFYLDAFHVLFQGPYQPLNSQSVIKFINNDDIEERISEIKVGDTLYQIPNSETITPTKVWNVHSIQGDDVGIFESSFNFLSQTGNLSAQYITNEFLFNTMLSYLKETPNSPFRITEQLLTQINDYFFEQSLKSYIFMPILIYILKQKIDEVYN